MPNILVPGRYLSLMDILFFNILPLEEVVFFFITNVLIVFGMALLLADESQQRFAKIKKQVQAWKEKRTLHRQGN